MGTWVEFALLRAASLERIGWTGLDRKFLAQLWGMAILAAAIRVAISVREPPHSGPRLQALMLIATSGGIYPPRASHTCC